MKRIAGLVAAAAMAVSLGIGGATAGASEHNQKSCEAAGGVWTNDQGTKSCTFVEEGKNPRFQCTTETQGQGNLGNKTQGPTEEEQNTGSGKCPPGQYPG